MGLFDKKEPCAICGGKVKGLFPWKIEGQLICNDCYGNVDLPNGMVNNMSLAQFNQYRAFREENDQLRQRFVTSLKVDFGWLDDKILFDFTNKLMCMDKNLNKTIFEGRQIRSFTIREDAYNLYEGSPAGLMCYQSSVPDRVMAMAPQINQYRMQEQMRRNMEMMRDMRDGDNDRTYYGSSTFDIPEPFNKFVVEIQMEHPYWRTLTLDTSGPSFSSTDPRCKRLHEQLSGKIQHHASAGSGPDGYRIPRCSRTADGQRHGRHVRRGRYGRHVWCSRHGCTEYVRRSRYGRTDHEPLRSHGRPACYESLHACGCGCRDTAL